MRLVRQYRAKLKLYTDETLTLFDGEWTTDASDQTFAEYFNLFYPIDPSPSIATPVADAASLASEDDIVLEIVEMPDPEWSQEQADEADGKRIR
jgi:hypothetical protein